MPAFPVKFQVCAETFFALSKPAISSVADSSFFIFIMMVFYPDEPGGRIIYNYTAMIGGRKSFITHIKRGERKGFKV